MNKRRQVWGHEGVQLLKVSTMQAASIRTGVLILIPSAKCCVGMAVSLQSQCSEGIKEIL